MRYYNKHRPMKSPETSFEKSETYKSKLCTNNLGEGGGLKYERELKEGDELKGI